MPDFLSVLILVFVGYSAGALLAFAIFEVRMWLIQRSIDRRSND